MTIGTAFTSASAFSYWIEPQTFAVPAPPQLAGGVQVPQLRTPPQPSPSEPQLAPVLAQVPGTH